MYSPRSGVVWVKRIPTYDKSLTVKDVFTKDVFYWIFAHPSGSFFFSGPVRTQYWKFTSVYS